MEAFAGTTLQAQHSSDCRTVTERKRVHLMWKEEEEEEEGQQKEEEQDQQQKHEQEEYLSSLTFAIEKLREACLQYRKELYN